MSLNEGFIKMAAPYLQMQEEEFKQMMVAYGSPVLVVMSAYQICIGDKTLKPIEDLPKEEKRRLYDKAKAWKPEGNTEQLINLCKAIYLRENI